MPRYALCSRRACSARVHPPTGANLRRAEPQERHQASRGKDHSPGQAARARAAVVAERRAKKRVGAMTRFGRQNRSGGARGGWIGRERAGTVSPPAPARPVEDERDVSNRPSTRRRGEAKHRRRIRLERSSRKRPPPTSTIAAILPGGKPHGRAPGGGPGPSAGHDWRKRRSGIVRRPAAPDSASRPVCAEGEQTS
jgi:hypothetical protein